MHLVMSGIWTHNFSGDRSLIASTLLKWRTTIKVLFPKICTFYCQFNNMSFFSGIYLNPYSFLIILEVMVNISVILWRSVLLVKETGVPGENHWPAASHWRTLSHNVVSSTPYLRGVQRIFKDLGKQTMVIQKIYFYCINNLLTLWNNITKKLWHEKVALYHILTLKYQKSVHYLIQPDITLCNWPINDWHLWHEGNVRRWSHA